MPANSAMETAEHCPTPILGSEEGKREKLKTDLLTQKSLPVTVGYTFPPLLPAFLDLPGQWRMHDSLGYQQLF